MWLLSQGEGIDRTRTVYETARVLKLCEQLVPVDFISHKVEHLSTNYGYRHLKISEVEGETCCAEARLTSKSSTKTVDKHLIMCIWTYGKPNA